MVTSSYTSYQVFAIAFFQLMFLARLLGEQSEMGASVEAYKRSIEMEPENVDLIHSLGMLHFKAGQSTRIQPKSQRMPISDGRPVKCICHLRKGTQL
jgi:hypothetical protein